jgi:hypothetical protein
LNGPGGDPAVTFVGVAVCDGDLFPRQGVESVEEGPPVLLDREHELSAALADVLRGGFHRVQRVRGHDLAVQIDLTEHFRRHRHLIGLRTDFGLGGDHRGGGVRTNQGREQVRLIPLGVFRATDRLAIEPDLNKPGDIAALTSGGRCGEPGQATQPLTNDGVEGLSVGVGQHSPDRGLRWRPGRQRTGTDVQIREDLGRDIADPAGDGRVAAHSSHHRRGG